jgi:RNA polymerase sigma factor (sigma-70 family)
LFALAPLMTDRKIITQENFEMLLSWLDSHQEAAAQKYEKIRSRLIRVFAGRGCYEAEDLADETINRVTLKVPQIKDTYVGETALYFYGVADKLHLEWLRKQKKGGFVELKETGKYQEEEESDEDYECLEKCLKTLPPDLRELIVEYYQGEKRAKIEHHKSLAEKWGLTVNALQTKTCRIRATLRKCVQLCVSG